MTDFNEMELLTRLRDEVPVAETAPDARRAFRQASQAPQARAVPVARTGSARGLQSPREQSAGCRSWRARPRSRSG